MLRPLQLVRLAALSLGLWLGATLCIRLLPQMLGDRGLSVISFAIMLPVGWACVPLIERGAGLARRQLLAGVGVVGAVAMMIDGLVLRWAPQVYGPTEAAALQGAAWLLWGYGVTLGIAVLIAHRRSAAAEDIGDRP